MPKNAELINDELFQLLRSKGYDPVMLDSSAKQVPIAEEAEVFQFKFVKDGTDYGTVTISLDGLHSITIYYNENIAKSPKGISKNGDVSWYGLIKQISKWAKNFQLSFELKDESHLKHDMAKRQHLKKLEESYYPTGKKSSYNDSVPNTKILIQHSRALEEGEQRFRNIAKIYVENAQGERFLLDTTRPGLAKVHARNIAEGGTPYDDRGKHISSLITEYSKMAGFVRATKGRQYNESVNQLVESGQQHYLTLRETLHKLTSKRGYSQYFESWTPTLIEDTIGQPDLAEMFKNSTLDPRIEGVLPILSRFAPAKSEMNEVKEFADWAENPKEEVVDEAPKLSPQEKFKRGLKKAGYDPDAGAKRLLDLIARQKSEREEQEKEFARQDAEFYGKKEVQQEAQKDGDYVMGKDKAKSIGPVLGKKSKQHPFKGKLVGGTFESSDPLLNIKKLSGLDK
jgi:hypothetical protein